jgi:hypothetical protein
MPSGRSDDDTIMRNSNSYDRHAGGELWEPPLAAPFRRSGRGMTCPDSDETPCDRFAPRGRLAARMGLGWAILLMTGCADQRGFLSGGPTVGQLKTSLSHVQFENEQLKVQLAKARQENRSLENRLVQEQVHNGDLAARLDDARNLLRDRGYELNTRLSDNLRQGSGPQGDANRLRVDDPEGRARTLPAGRTNRRPRTPPSARIGDHLDDPFAAPADDDPEEGSVSMVRPRLRQRRPPFPADDPWPHIEEDRFNWQPVAITEEPESVPRR